MLVPPSASIADGTKIPFEAGSPPGALGTLGGMSTCGMTRLLIPGFLVGLAVATFARNDLYGWIAAGLTMGIVAAVQKVRDKDQVCVIAPPMDTDRPPVEDASDASGSDVLSR